MTALTAPTHAVAAPDEALAPIPWRGMTWVTWRQHRAALAGLVAALGGLAVYLWVSGLELHHDYAVAAACRPAGSATCAALASAFTAKNSFLTNGLVLQVLPPLMGAFVGAPWLARELETGTFRFAWTQGLGRRRWVHTKLAALALVVTGAATAMGALFSWYYGPYFAPGNQALGLPRSTPLAPGLFDLRAIVFPAWTLGAFALGCLAAIVLRRVVPAIVVTLAVYSALAVAVGGVLRQHYLAPLVTRALTVPSTAWVLSRRWFTSAGRPRSPAAIAQALQQGAPQLAGKGGVPDAIGPWRYLVRHGFVQVTTYQPAARFWPFQSIEGGWLLALSAVAMVVTVRLVRRRPA